MVRETDKAWHVGNCNPYTIGLEHEAYGNIYSYFTPAMYEASADLTRDNAQEYFLAQDEVKKLIGDKALKKLVFVPGRLVNLVVG